MGNRNSLSRMAAACLALLALAVPCYADGDYVPLFKPLTSSSMVIANGAQGSGFLIDRAGRLMITNRHVVGDQKTASVIVPLIEDGQVLVRRDYYLRQGHRIRAKVLDSDPKRDLALLQLSEQPGALMEIKLATTSSRKDDRVHMIGNPGKKDQVWVYSVGKVRAVSKEQLVYENGQRVGARVIELTADGKLGKGASGGPVANDRGDLIGVISSGRPDGTELSCIDVSEVRYFLGTSFRKMATAALQRREYYQALALCDKALTTYPHDPVSHNERGAALSYLDSLEEAIRSYTAALKIDPTLVRAYRNRGSAYFHQGKYEEAVDDCTEAIRLNPTYLSAYQTRAKAWTKLNKTAEAEKDLAKIKELSSAPAR